MDVNDRDIEIFKFLIEMKFADLGVLADRFFNCSSVNLSSARNRLRLLESGGFVFGSFAEVGSSKKYYVLTSKGRRELLKNHDYGFLPSISKSISPALFKHNWNITLSRSALEKQGRALEWKPEKILRGELSLNKGATASGFMPDGLFLTTINRWCAFELEISPKRSERYRDKVNWLAEQIYAPDGLFDFCLFVTCSPVPFRVLTELTKDYGNRFRIQVFEDLIGGRNVRHEEERRL